MKQGLKQQLKTLGIICCLVFSLIPLFESCANSNNTSKTESATKNNPVKHKTSGTYNFRKYIGSIGSITTYDKNRFLEKEIAWLVDSNHIVCRLTPLLNCNRAVFSPWGQKNSFEIAGFSAIDRTNDFAILKVSGYKGIPIPLATNIAKTKDQTIYLSKPQGNTLPLHQGILLSYTTIKGAKRYRVTNSIPSLRYGTALFLDNGKSIGLGYSEIVDYDQQTVVIPSSVILPLIHSKSQQIQPLANIRSRSSAATSAANSRIKGLVIHTDMGNITIRLFNSTPEYRDNFIALVKEHYYDSLLIHRVVPGFCIQTGAADTRYAGPDDIVGWKGPGYTLPAHIVPGLYHKRGMIGVPRLSDDKNYRKRANGSQFYIITGRTYNNEELNEIEKKNHHHFTEEQRKVYRTIGGAPHLDGGYTIFGEVTSGMDVADRINKVPTNSNGRPLKDIRVKTITILK